MRRPSVSLSTASLYRNALSSQTRNLPAMPTARGKCLRCGRCFKCLDTHLRVSATCRDVRQRQSAPPTMDMNAIFSTANLNSVTTLPGNSNCTSAVATTSNTATHSPSVPVSAATTLHFKQSLRFPSVLCATTVEEMNTILYDGIYNIISSRFGTRSQPKPKQQ